MKKFNSANSVILLLAFGFWTLPAHAGEAASNKTYDRVIASGQLGCGYIVWPPMVTKDINTREFGGVTYEVSQALAAALELKLVMQQEFNLATYMQDLNNGRYDIECTGGWPNAKRGKYIEYSKPYGYFSIVAVVRNEDVRQGELGWINDPAVKVAVIDGETSAMIQARRYPKAAAVELPASSNASDLLMNVMTGKADVTFTDMPSFTTFEKTNPGKLRALTNKPVRLVPLTFSIPAGEYRLQNMVNTALDELMLDGVIDRILAKYDASGTMLKPVPPPHQGRY